MGKRGKYRRRAETPVTAVRIDLDLVGFSFRKWGGVQEAKAGDWLVNNAGDTYTVDGKTFARTYRQLSPGVYEKTTGVWAMEAVSAGTVETLEGTTDYAEGDYIVFDDADGPPRYAISAGRFHEIYEPDEEA